MTSFKSCSILGHLLRTPYTLGLDLGLKWVGYVMASASPLKSLIIKKKGAVKRRDLISFLGQIKPKTIVVIGISSDIDGKYNYNNKLTDEEATLIKDLVVFYQDEFNSSQEAEQLVGNSKLAIQAMSAQIILERFLNEN